MDPLTTASTFATLVSLLAEFRSQRHDTSSDQLDEFMAWLSEQRHEELKSILLRNSGGIIAIRGLLKEDRKLFAERLDRIDRTLAALASADDAFRELAAAIRPDARLSNQALNVLRQINASGASRALEHRTQAKFALVLMDGGGGQIEYDEPRFIEDDVKSLVDLGLLRLDYNSTGKRVYVFTRNAAELVSSLERDV